MSRVTSRREFLKTASVGAAALSVTASSYARVAGANDRISIGVIGCGSRGLDAHMPGVNKYAKEQNIEITAVADPWRVRRDMAAAKTKEWYGREARAFVSYRDLVALKDVDAVVDRVVRPPAYDAPEGCGAGEERRLLREAVGQGL